MHIHGEHQLHSTKTQMKQMFSSHSKTTPDEPPTAPAVTQPLTQQPGLLPRDEETESSSDKDLNHDQHLRSGLHDFLSNNDPTPIEDNDLPWVTGNDPQTTLQL